MNQYNCDVCDIWIDENNNEHKVVAYIIKNLNGRYVMHGKFTDGKLLPLENIKENYRKKGYNYINTNLELW